MLNFNNGRGIRILKLHGLAISVAKHVCSFIRSHCGRFCRGDCDVVDLALKNIRAFCIMLNDVFFLLLSGIYKLIYCFLHMRKKLNFLASHFSDRNRCISRLSIQSTSQNY